MARTSPVFAFAGVPRVNLMPPLEIERRKRSSLIRGWTWGVVAALVVAGLIIAGAFALKFAADQALVAEHANSTVLLTELGSLAEVSSAVATEAELTQFRAEAMGADFAWGPVVSTITDTLPAGVELKGFDLTSGGVPQSPDATTQVGLAGTMTLESPDPIDLPATIRQLRALESVSEVDGKALTTGQQTVGSYSYELEITFDQSIYTGDYAATEGAG